MSSGQPQKIGVYQGEAIDHAFYSPKYFELHLDNSVLALPLTFELSERELQEASEARPKDFKDGNKHGAEVLQRISRYLYGGTPDTNVPSDHLPVVVDFKRLSGDT